MLKTLLAVVVLSGLTVMACAGPTPTVPPAPAPTRTATPVPTTTPIPTATPIPPTPTPAPLVSGVDLLEFQIFPQTISVQPGQPVTLNIANRGRFPHDVAFHGFPEVNQAIAKPLTAGESKTVQVSFDQPGLYPFYCPVGAHQNSGMVGVLRVVGPQAATPTVKIRAPAQGGTLVGATVQVTVAVEILGFELDEAAIGSATNKAGAGHWHLLLDGELVGPVGKLHAFVQGVTVGEHTVKVELHNNDHSPLSPAMEDTVTFNVVPPPTPTPRPPTPTATATP